MDYWKSYDAARACCAAQDGKGKACPFSFVLREFAFRSNEEQSRDEEENSKYEPEPKNSARHDSSPLVDRNNSIILELIKYSSIIEIVHFQTQKVGVVAACGCKPGMM